MIQKTLGVGLAPDVVMLGDRVYVAYGQASPTAALVIVQLTLTGQEISRVIHPDGFYNSWPRFGGPWLAYKLGAPSFAPALVNVETGEHLTFPGQADGNFGLCVNEQLGIMAYMNGAYPIWFGAFAGGASASGLNGKPDGLDTLVSLSEVTLRADTRLDVQGMQYPVRALDLVVGEWDKGFGIATQLDGDVLRVALAGQNSPNPRCAQAGDLYALTVGGDAVWLVLASREELLQLPPASGPVPPEPIPPEPIPPQPKPPIPIPPKPPAVGDSCMQMFVTVDPSKVIAAKAVKPAVGFPGCFNYIVEDGHYFSAHGDLRPNDGTPIDQYKPGVWEAGQPTGAGIVTFWADNEPFSYGVVLTDKLPK